LIVQKQKLFIIGGYYYLKKEDTLSAVDDFSTSLILDPNFYYGYNIFNGLANAPVLDSVYKKNLESKFKKSMEEKGYTEVNGRYNLGLFFLKVRKHKQAILKFQKCLNQEEYKARAYYSMGLAYYYIRQYEEALDAFSSAAGMDYKTIETQRYLLHISRLNKIKKRNKD